MALGLVREPVGQNAAGVHVVAAGLGRDREPGGHRHAELRHLGETDPFAAQQLTPSRRRLVEVVDVCAFVGNLMPVTDQHIVAMGGGGTSDAVLAEVFALVPKPRPRMLYVGTGSAEDPAPSWPLYEAPRGKAESHRSTSSPGRPQTCATSTLATT